MERGRRNNYHHNNNGNGGGRYNNNNHRARREYHSSQRNGNNFHNNNIGYGHDSSGHYGHPPLCGSTWRSIAKQQKELVMERSRAIKDVDKRQFDAERAEIAAMARAREPLNKDGNGDVVEKGAQGKSKGDQGAVQSSSNSGAAVPPSIKKNLKERSSFDAERAHLMEKFNARERKLDAEMHRFCQAMENRLHEVDRRAVFDPVLIRNKILEREIFQREQTIQHLQHYAAELEATTNMQHDQLQQMNVEFNLEKIRMQQELEMERDLVMTKARSDIISEYLQGTLWQDPFMRNGSGGGSNGPDMMSQYPLQSHSFHEIISASPCLQPMRNEKGDGLLSDLRDRYEDLTMKANFGVIEKMDWTLTMLNKVVMFYEAQGMRVYEESLANKFVSTFMWAPNDARFPNKFEGSFAMGHGDTEIEATKNATQQAYLTILNLGYEAPGNADDNNRQLISEANPKLLYETDFPMRRNSSDYICKFFADMKVFDEYTKTDTSDTNRSTDHDDSDNTGQDHESENADAGQSQSTDNPDRGSDTDNTGLDDSNNSDPDIENPSHDSDNTSHEIENIDQDSDNTGHMTPGQDSDTTDNPNESETTDTSNESSQLSESVCGSSSEESDLKSYPTTTNASDTETLAA